MKNTNENKTVDGDIKTTRSVGVGHETPKPVGVGLRTTRLRRNYPNKPVLHL